MNQYRKRKCIVAQFCPWFYNADFLYKFQTHYPTLPCSKTMENNLLERFYFCPRIFFIKKVVVLRGKKALSKMFWPIVQLNPRATYKDFGITWKFNLGLNCLYCEYEKLLYKGKTKIKPRIKFSLNIIPLVKVANGKVITHFFKAAILVPTWSL